jgi:hypothetical protein
VPVWHGVEDPNYFTAEEYAGGYDDVALTVATGADEVEVELYYQTTSREYIEFLRDEIRGTATSLKGNGAGGDPAYIIQTDPFFSALKAWGDVIWQLWDHNKHIAGAAPVAMAEASIGGETACEPPVPTGLAATTGHLSAQLSWDDMHSADPSVVGYRVYYDQAGKSQLLADLINVTQFADTGLTKGQQYCYKVTAKYAECESDPSATVCVVADSTTGVLSVPAIETGAYVSTGKGKTATTTFEFKTAFAVGDTIVIRGRVADAAGAPIAGATVSYAITGPETAAVTATSDDTGLAEGTWKTSSPNRKGQGGTTPGAYTISAGDVQHASYTWDGLSATVTVTLN